MLQIPVADYWLKTQNYDSALREACDWLSQQGIRNFIHYNHPRQVELLDYGYCVEPVIDHQLNCVQLAVEPGFGYQSSTGSYPSPPIHFAASH